MNRCFRAIVIPLVKRLSWIPLVDVVTMKLKQRLVAKQNTGFDSPFFRGDEVKLTIDKGILVGVAHFGNQKILNPVKDNTNKYVDFFEANGIPYELFNISTADWGEKVKKFDMIVWAVSSRPCRLEEAKNKLFIIEKVLNTPCYPPFNSVFSYENKVLQYYLFTQLDIPHVPTFVSNDKSETLQFIKKSSYPIVSKISTGSGSRGVELIKNYTQARRMVERIFSSGVKTYYPELGQKDYVYFQQYLPEAKYDVRVIVIGDYVLGYYRMRPKKDFRASGAGLVVKKDLPLAAMKIAVSCKQKLDAFMIAVDMISPDDGESFMVIEASISFGVETPEQLHVNGIPGYYKYQDGIFKFYEGRYWVQHLVLREFIKTHAS